MRAFLGASLCWLSVWVGDAVARGVPSVQDPSVGLRTRPGASFQVAFVLTFVGSDQPEGDDPAEAVADSLRSALAVYVSDSFLVVSARADSVGPKCAELQARVACDAVMIDQRVEKANPARLLLNAHLRTYRDTSFIAEKDVPLTPERCAAGDAPAWQICRIKAYPKIATILQAHYLEHMKNAPPP